MELNWLKYFYAVAKEGGYLRASERLKVAQPSISKLVRQLEDDLGAKLFEKSGRNVRLTKFGNDVYRHCEVIFREAERIAELNPKKKGQTGGALSLGASEAIASYYIPEILEGFLKMNPLVRPTIMTGTSADLCRKLVMGQVEFLLLLHISELSPELEIQKKWEIRHSVVVSSNKAADRATLARFIGSREVDDTGSKHFPTLQKLQRNISETSIAISTNSITAHKKMVIRGMGVAVMPTRLVESELKKGKLKELLASEKLSFPLQLVVRKDRVLSLNAEKFVESLKLIIHK